MATRIVRATLAYDGTEFVGWQVQDSGRTVQGVLQDGLERMHGHPVRVSGAGRTDSGVHAAGQVVSFETDIESLPGWRFRDAVNAFLPHDVRVLESSEAPAGFDARRSARLRVYRYSSFCGPVLPPQLRRFRHFIRRRPDLARLNEMAALLVGDRDFTSLSAAGDESQSRVRTVSASSFHAEGDTVVYTIAAISFLWKMVRTIVGTLLELEGSGGGPAELESILAARDRALAGPTAPARGLSLDRVVYDEA